MGDQTMTETRKEIKETFENNDVNVMSVQKDYKNVYLVEVPDIHTNEVIKLKDYYKMAEILPNGLNSLIVVIEV